jgi:hypothetical protein
VHVQVCVRFYQANERECRGLLVESLVHVVLAEVLIALLLEGLHGVL